MWTILLGLFFIGLFFGSFYNVVSLRTLSEESIVLPPSHCTSCNHRLYPKDLIPVFSYLFIGGKCRYCKEKISWIYPFGELLTGITFALTFWIFGFTMEWALSLVFMSCLIWATVSDLKEKIVPDRFVVIGTIATLIMVFAKGENIAFHLLGGIGMFGILYLLFVFSGGKLGGADVKLYGLIGLNLGFMDAMLSLFIASMLGLIIMLPVMKINKLGRKFEIPFVPFITLSVLIVYIMNEMGLYAATLMIF